MTTQLAETRAVTWTSPRSSRSATSRRQMDEMVDRLKGRARASSFAGRFATESH